MNPLAIPTLAEFLSVEIQASAAWSGLTSFRKKSARRQQSQVPRSRRLESALRSAGTARGRGAGGVSRIGPGFKFSGQLLKPFPRHGIADDTGQTAASVERAAAQAR